MKNPYYLADRSILLLNKRAIRRFKKAQRDVALLDFEDIVVIRILRGLYEELNSDNEKAFLDLARSVYQDSCEEIGEEDSSDKITRFWILDFLDQYNPVTKYVYSKEVTRKRDRTEEAINSSVDKSREFKRGLMLWSQMTAQYALDVSVAAQVKAYRDNGIKRIMWNTQRDGRECDECASRDGKIYPIENAPPKAHWGDRCYFTPVLED